MICYIARHGQTTWNARDVVCGRADPPLTDRGREQAGQLARQCLGKGITRIFSSPLIRARETAQAASDLLGVPVTVDPRLLEQDFGKFEECHRFDPEYLSYRKDLAVRFPGGESCAQVIARVYALLDEIRASGQPGNVLLVSHGGACRAMNTYFCDVANEDYFRFRLANCELKAYEL